MITMNMSSFNELIESLRSKLIAAPQVDVGKWQSQDIRNRPEMITRELRDVHISFPMPQTYDDLVLVVKPNLPWAENHFQERVSGQPLNPPPSEAWWPYAQRGNEEYKQNQIFSHTYPERFWPKVAGSFASLSSPNHGIRYSYGDLGDLVNLLKSERYTRQAYLPVWFPEDTGNALGVRVPCTLGYHFLFRDDKLHLTYFIRSCDFMRHFRDDVYMACRLASWVANAAFGPEMSSNLGHFTMVIPSLHIFQGDLPMLKHEAEADTKLRNMRLLGAFS